MTQALYAHMNNKKKKERKEQTKKDLANHAKEFDHSH
jgi:hypothetical protein